VWPRWLPIRARLPLIAQIVGGVALVAAISMPRWSDVPPPSTPSSSPARPADVNPSGPPRPAHLNVDLRHAFRTVDLSITVDGKRALYTTLTGSGKRFGVFGKRADRTFAKTLDVPPGVRIVRVRLRSEHDKFDQTRVERFDLDSASVATLRIAADKSGLSIVAERPPVFHAPPVAPVTQMAQATQMAQEASALAELYDLLRSMLIGIAGFVASSATAFVVQEYLKSRRELIFRSQSGVSPSPQ
jgi:hypothetical protein